jgi:hypothetical protein
MAAQLKTRAEREHVAWTQRLATMPPAPQEALTAHAVVGRNILTTYLDGLGGPELHATATAMIAKLEEILEEDTGSQKVYSDQRPGFLVHLSDQEVTRIERRARSDARRDIGTLGRGRLRRLFLGNGEEVVERRIAEREEQARARRAELAEVAHDLEDRAAQRLESARLGRRAIEARAAYDKEVAEQDLYRHTREAALRRPSNLRVRVLMARAAQYASLAGPDDIYASSPTVRARQFTRARALVVRARAARRQIRVPER